MGMIETHTAVPDNAPLGLDTDRLAEVVQRISILKAIYMTQSLPFAQRTHYLHSGNDDAAAFVKDMREWKTVIDDLKILKMVDIAEGCLYLTTGGKLYLHRVGQVKFPQLVEKPVWR